MSSRDSVRPRIVLPFLSEITKPDAPASCAAIGTAIISAITVMSKGVLIFISLASSRKRI